MSRAAESRQPISKTQEQDLNMDIVYSLLSQIQAWIGSHTDVNGIIFDILIPAYATS
ncbi:MAG: hypothetical protein LBM56_03980 [Burkholderiaceae bacterium]|jgi:hypothetical protein|nr:hypothetical protein [Burkholderiaceae bacterium]